MNQNDIKQFIIDTMRENNQPQSLGQSLPAKRKPRQPNNQRNGSPVPFKGEDAFSKKMLIFLSVLMLITSGFVKYVQLVEGIDVSDLKIPMATLYGASIGFYQLRRGLESWGLNIGQNRNNGNNSQINQNQSNDDFDDFDAFGDFK